MKYMENKILEDLKEYFKNTPKKKILRDWNKLKKYDKFGVSIKDYFK